MNNQTVRRVAIDLNPDSQAEEAKLVMPPTESNLKKLEQPQRNNENLKAGVSDQISSI